MLLSGLDLCTHLNHAHDLQQYWWLISARELIQLNPGDDQDEEAFGEAASEHYWRGADGCVADYPHLYGLVTLAWRFHSSTHRIQHIYFL